MHKSLILIAVFSLTSLSAFADIIWSADATTSTNVNDFFKRFDDGNYPQDYCVNKGDEKGVAASTAQVINDPKLGSIWKINKPIGRKRGEFARAEGAANSFSPKEGDDVYIAWNWKIDTVDNATINEEISVFQWKSADPHNQNYPLNLEYDGNLSLHVFGPDYIGGKWPSERRSVLWKKKVPQNQWVSLILRVKVNKEDFGGIIELWFNGVKQEFKNSKTNLYKVQLSEDNKTAYHRTNDGKFVYPKWGIYNKTSCQYNVNTYYHDMKIGTSLASVMSKSDLKK